MAERMKSRILEEDNWKGEREKVDRIGKYN